MIQVKLWCDVSECNVTETSFNFVQPSAPCRPWPSLAGRAVEQSREEQSIPGPLLSPAFVCASTFSKQSPVSNIPRGLCCSLNGICGRQTQHCSLSAPACGLWWFPCPRPGLSPESCPKTLPTSQFFLAFPKPTRLGFAWGCRGNAPRMWGQRWRDAGGGAVGCACGGCTEG